MCGFCYRSSSGAVSPTPQSSSSPTSQRQQDSGFAEQLCDLNTEPLMTVDSQQQQQQVPITNSANKTTLPLEQVCFVLGYCQLCILSRCCMCALFGMQLCVVFNYVGAAVLTLWWWGCCYYCIK